MTRHEFDRADRVTIVSEANGSTAMLLYEDLARARMREVREAVGQVRLANRLSTARRWRRLARWAAARAVRAADLL